jgi:hypothetical protein
MDMDDVPTEGGARLKGGEQFRETIQNKSVLMMAHIHGWV